MSLMNKLKLNPLYVKIALLAASGVVVLVIGYGVGNVIPIFNITGKCKECEKCEECKECDTCEETGNLDDNNECETCEDATVINHPSYKLTFGQETTITVPKGWYVSRMDVEYHDMTYSEFKNLNADKGQIGILPTLDNLYLTLTDGVSVITVRKEVKVWPDGIGWAGQCLESGATVVDEPTNNPDTYTGNLAEYGFARTYSSEQYSYVTIMNVQDGYCYDSEWDYVVIDGNSGGTMDPWYFTFAGDEDDLSIADGIYRNSFAHATPDIEID